MKQTSASVKTADRSRGEEQHAVGDSGLGRTDQLTEKGRVSGSRPGCLKTDGL